MHAEIRTPHEIESEIGLTEGNIFQGELTIDQLLFNRPFPGYGQYRMPLKNHVHVRLVHASRGRRVICLRCQCGARDPAGPQAPQLRARRRLLRRVADAGSLPTKRLA